MQVSLEQQQQEKEKWALGSLLLNIFLTALKFVFAYITGSLALMAEAIHSFSDLVVSLISLISVKLSAYKAKDFPYGLYKIENIASVIIGLFLFFTAYEIIKEAFFEEKPREINHIEYAIGVMVITMITTFIYSRFESKAAERLNSPTLKADAEHIWADFLASLIVIVGLVGTMLGYNLDKYAAIVVSLFIIHSGWEIFFNGLKALLDISLEKEEIEEIKKIVKSYPSVIKIKNIRGRSAGSFKFLELDILMHNYSLRKTHEIVDKIEEEIKKHIPNVSSVSIHYEPERQKGLKLGILVRDSGELADFDSAIKLKIVDINEDGKVERTVEENVKPENLGDKISKSGIDIIIATQHPEDFETRWKIVESGILVWETDKDEKKAIKEVIDSWEEYKNKEKKDDKQNSSGD